MTEIGRSRAAASISLAARRNRWPLKSDTDLKFVTLQLKAALALWETSRETRTMPA
jgi:hypothetical protein